MLHPGVHVVKLPRPDYSPAAPMEGFIRIDAQDVISIRADRKNQQPKIKFEPVAKDKYHMQQDVILARVHEALAKGVRRVDTSNWLG